MTADTDKAAVQTTTTSTTIHQYDSTNTLPTVPIDEPLKYTSTSNVPSIGDESEQKKEEERSVPPKHFKSWPRKTKEGSAGYG
mmetsp:Transcript_28586/g.67590  ORF Transcript_28586/g.67590 Transcript_28586/m.67590 type:complete len:83 (-) Transcript_28586:309-557(-)